MEKCTTGSGNQGRSDDHQCGFYFRLCPIITRSDEVFLSQSSRQHQFKSVCSNFQIPVVLCRTTGKAEGTVPVALRTEDWGPILSTGYIPLLSGSDNRLREHGERSLDARKNEIELVGIIQNAIPKLQSNVDTRQAQSLFRGLPLT